MGDALFVVKGIWEVPSEVIGITTGLLHGEISFGTGFFGQFTTGLTKRNLLLLCLCVFVLVGVDFLTRKKSGLAIYKSLPVAVRWFVYYIVALCVEYFMILQNTNTSEFIYFQF